MGVVTPSAPQVSTTTLFSSLIQSSAKPSHNSTSKEAAGGVEVESSILIEKEGNSVDRITSSMSQDFQQQEGIYAFPNGGFERQQQHEHQQPHEVHLQHHHHQQIRRDSKIRPVVQDFDPSSGSSNLVGIHHEHETAADAQVYETGGGMLSEMFNFVHGTSGVVQGSELLEHQITAANFNRDNNSRRGGSGSAAGPIHVVAGQIVGGLGQHEQHQHLHQHQQHHHHHPISGMHADSTAAAAAMQLFLTNPQPRSPSPPAAGPHDPSSSTLHMLLPDPCHPSSSNSDHMQGFNSIGGGGGGGGPQPPPTHGEGQGGFSSGAGTIMSHHHQQQQFTWVPNSSEHHDPPHHHHHHPAGGHEISGGNENHVVEGQGLSLSLASHLDAAKAEELRMSGGGGVSEGGGMIYFSGGDGGGAGASSSSGGYQYSFNKSLAGHPQTIHLHHTAGGLIGGGGGIPHHHHIGYGSISPSPHNSVGVVNAMRNSRFAKPAQELLEEFCSVGRGRHHQLKQKSKFGSRNNNSNPSTSGGGGDGAAGAGGSSSSAAAAANKDQVTPLSAAERVEHQRRKVKLLQMLDEVDRRYNHYCEQMQMVVNSFDLVMGFGAAVPYTALAQKAMSRHFRCLKDAILAQLKHSCELLGEKDVTGNSGLTKGETPRLKVLEQSLRQQRVFHQMGMMEQEAWRPQRGLPERSVNVLRAWLFEHFLHPYPSDADKHLLGRQTGLSRNQVSNWFINARVRLWKPMVEDMYQQEAKEEDGDDEDDHGGGVKEKDQSFSGNTTGAQTSTTPPPPPPQTAAGSSSSSAIAAATATNTTTAVVGSTTAAAHHAGSNNSSSNKRSEFNTQESDPSIKAINNNMMGNNNNNTSGTSRSQHQQQLHQHQHQQIKQPPPPHPPPAPHNITTSGAGATATTTFQHGSSAPGSLNNNSVVMMGPTSGMIPVGYHHGDNDSDNICAAADNFIGTTTTSSNTAAAVDHLHNMGSTMIRFGTTTGDVSLTLGLRHAGNTPEKTAFHVRDFGNC